MTARARTAALGTLVALATAACNLDLAPRPTLASRLRFDCGVVRPNLSVGCRDGDPIELRKEELTTPVAVPEGPDGVSAERQMACRDFSPDPDAGRLARAGYLARCERLEGGDALVRRLTLEGHGERRCVQGGRGEGSAGEPKPLWRFAVATPAAVESTLAITAEASLEARCDLLVGDGTRIPLRPGRREVYRDALLPASTTPLALDCYDGLGAVGCWGYEPGAEHSPEVATERVFLTVTVTPR